MKPLNFDVIKQSVINKGYIWEFNKPMIIGIRTATNLPNVFDDYIVLCQEFKNKYLKGWMATTEAGLYWLNNPMNVKGTGVLVPNQYRNCWKIGTHGKGLNAHEALVQIAPVEVYRDSDKDNIAEKTNIVDKGIFGINIHSTGKTSWIAPKVDKWSAGCQVFPNYDSFKEFMKELKDSKFTVFSYILLEEKDIV